jgi:hypothetical protein
LVLTCGHVGVEGVALDVAGAVVLAWSFSAKRPEQIRREVPKTVPTTFAYALFPKGLADSLVRQRAEARLGLFLLVSGFLMQALNSVFDLGQLETTGQRWTALVLALATWLLTWVLGMRLYVPWDEQRTARAIPDE